MVADKADDPKILGDVSKCTQCGKPAAGSVTVMQDNKMFMIILCEECISKIEREQSGDK